jgi:DNA-binding NarL/FixJ family response regulator
MDERRLTVFLLDDHELVRRGVRDLLLCAGDFDVVGEAGTAADALALIPQLHPDVAVLDIRLPDGNGIDVCRAVQTLAPGVHCLMLTSFPDDDAIVRSVMAGASGFVEKQIRGPELIDAIRRVAAGQSLLDPHATEVLLERLRHPVRVDTRLAGLTERERDVLRLMADGCTNRQIANELTLAEKTVKNHVSSILAKLGMVRRTEAAVFAATLDRDGLDARTTDRPAPRPPVDRSPPPAPADKPVGATDPDPRAWVFAS